MGLSMGGGGAYKKQLKEQYPVTLLRMYQDVGNSKDARGVREPWEDPFASRLAEFDATLKLLRITDQW